MVHKQDERSENLKHQGAETVVCDFLELKGLRLALAGVSGAYFGYPVAPGLIEAAAFFAQAAKEAHLEIIVNMSQVSARSDAFSDATIAHWMSERVFDWSGVKTTHIRPTFFFDWFLYFAKGAQAGLIQMPFESPSFLPKIWRMCPPKLWKIHPNTTARRTTCTGPNNTHLKRRTRRFLKF